MAQLRQEGPTSTDAETLARWHLAEMIAPGGDASRAALARARLDEQQSEHYLAHLARGLDDAWHGKLSEAAFHFLDAADQARAYDSVEARLVAWFAVARAVTLSEQASELWVQARERVQAMIEQPGGMGWRARAHLVQWWLDEIATRDGPPAGAAVRRLGCVTAVRLAGPFGTNAPVHLHRSFPPEAPGPWPQHWGDDGEADGSASIRPTLTRGCEIRVAPPVQGGVYYGESYLELDQEQDLLLAVQGALAVWVDDRQVLDRDPRTWGVWPRFGVHLRLGPGRHRVLARLPEGRTLVRVMHPDGKPLSLEANTDASVPYALHAPELLEDPNDLMRFVGPAGVVGEPDVLTRFLAAELAHLEGEADVASVLIAPLVDAPEAATGPALASAAEFVISDPLMAQSEAIDRVRELHTAAAAADPELWRSHLVLALQRGSSKGMHEAVGPLRGLVRRFERVPALWGALANVLGRLGWQPEYRGVVAEMQRRFVDDPSALVAALSLAEQTGKDEEAERLMQRLMQLEPTGEALLERALRRRDYATALSELNRLEALDPTRADELSLRAEGVRVKAGQAERVLPLLKALVAETPRSGDARLALADAQRSEGDAAALRRALAAATEAEADTRPLEQAIDAVEARTDFAPYRLDGRAVIEDYERAGEHQSATAARVLDYAAVWVHSDGSSRMLEHEIIRIQSAEAIGKFAEHRRLPGLVLHMRVIKKDGRTLEPERVEGKPTVTFPHLEVGDYIETEQVQGFAATQRGRRYEGMRWFFREEDVAYARSEFVLVAPKHRSLDIEVTGAVPEPRLTTEGLFVTRRWRVDRSPAAPVEPLSPPVPEFLPSVRVAWGDDLAHRLRVLSEQVADTVPVDPRIRSLAQSIVAPAVSPREQARKAYRWVQDSIKDGNESDARKVLTSQQGNRWLALRLLLRALDIPVRYLVVNNRLSPPARGPMSEAEAYSVPLLAIGAEGQTTWLTVQEKYAPFGYVPVEARGMSAYELSVEGPRPVQVPDVGDQDRLEYEGFAQLQANGAAELQLEQRFVGKYAVRMRAGLEQVPEGRLHEVIESRLLGRALPGARLNDFEVIGRDDLERPLVIRMDISLGHLAEVRPDGLVITPPLMPRLSLLSSLPERQTPLLISEAMHQSVRLSIAVAPGSRVLGLAKGRLEHGQHRVEARDSQQAGRVVIDREASIVAGRISPEQYASFAEFTRSAERLLQQTLVLRRAARADEAL